jgi:hypothetical protein
LHSIVGEVKEPKPQNIYNCSMPARTMIETVLHQVSDQMLMIPIQKQKIKIYYYAEVAPRANQFVYLQCSFVSPSAAPMSDEKPTTMTYTA